MAQPCWLFAMPSLKEKIGCWLHERWRTELVLSPMLSQLTGHHWVDLCNRHERLGRQEKGARSCPWEDSSFLTVARFFPGVGGRLLRYCLTEWPIHFQENPAGHGSPVSPEMSVILPVGGRDRVPLFLAVLRAFWGQRADNIEIIVVEYAVTPEYEPYCPADVTYLFLPMESGGQFNKSLAMNRAVDRASAPLVLLHDADLVPPAAYVESLLFRFRQGWEAVRPVRFAFHLEQDDSDRFIESK
ncbi:MAG: glycosyltransferase, partial [Desulfobacterales bacterium]|nr:glycosyltransferase [Desulfobacterales bacterium]